MTKFVEEVAGEQFFIIIGIDQSLEFFVPGVDTPE